MFPYAVDGRHMIQRVQWIHRNPRWLGSRGLFQSLILCRHVRARGGHVLDGDLHPKLLAEECRLRTRTTVDVIVPWMGDFGHNDEAEWIFHMRIGWGGSDF